MRLIYQCYRCKTHYEYDANCMYTIEITKYERDNVPDIAPIASVCHICMSYIIKEIIIQEKESTSSGLCDICGMKHDF